MTAPAGLPTSRPSASTASLVIEAVTTVSMPTSIFTCAVVAPLVIATTVPGRMLRAESFIERDLVEQRDGCGAFIVEGKEVRPHSPAWILSEHHGGHDLRSRWRRLLRGEAASPDLSRRIVGIADKGGAMDAQTLDPNRFAAIVYDDGAEVDGLMTTVRARSCFDEGVDARGIVQLPPEADGCGPAALMKLRDVATGEIIPLCQNLGSGAGSCSLDTSALAGAASRLRDAATERPDILFFSKFGKQEAAGRGMRAELAFAISEGRTVLTAVKRALLPAWDGFTGGRGTLLDHRHWVVRDWWREVSRRAA